MIRKTKKKLLYIAAGLCFFGGVLIIMFSLGVEGVGRVKNVWEDLQVSVIALKYCLFLGFFIYFEQISEWVANRKQKPELKEMFISKKYLFFIPIVAMEILRYA